MLLYDDFPPIVNIDAIRSWSAAKTTAVDCVPVVAIKHLTLYFGKAVLANACGGGCLANPLEVLGE